MKTLKEFNAAVKKREEEIKSGMMAENILARLQSLDQFRNGGLIDVTMSQAIKEMACADVLGIEFVDDMTLSDMVELWNEQFIQ